MANADVLEEVEQLDEFYERRPRSSVRRYNGGQPRPAQADAESSNTRFPARASEMARRTTGSHEMQEARVRAYKRAMPWWNIPASIGIASMAAGLLFGPHIMDHWTYGDPEQTRAVSIEAVVGLGDSKEKPSTIYVTTAKNGMLMVNVAIGGSKEIKGYAVPGTLSKGQTQAIVSVKTIELPGDDRVDIVIESRTGYTYGIFDRPIVTILYGIEGGFSLTPPTK